MSRNSKAFGLKHEQTTRIKFQKFKNKLQFSFIIIIIVEHINYICILYIYTLFRQNIHVYISIKSIEITILYNLIYLLVRRRFVYAILLQNVCKT